MTKRQVITMSRRARRYRLKVQMYESETREAIERSYSPGFTYWCSTASIKLKRPQAIETRTVPRIAYALITAKTQRKVHFVQYLNFNELFLN